MSSTYFYGGTATASPSPEMVLSLWDEIGQSPEVSAAPRSPSSDPNSVAYNPEDTLTAGPMASLAPALLAQRKRVVTWNIATQAWEFFKVGDSTYNTTTQKWEVVPGSGNIFGFSGNEGSGNPTYVPGIPSCVFFAYWWDENMPANQFLAIRRAGAVGQALPFFLKNYGDGVNNIYHTLGTTLWGPSLAALPAIKSQLAITRTRTLGRMFWQGETEGVPPGDIPNWANNQAQYEADMRADNYYQPDADSRTLLPDTVVLSGTTSEASNKAVNLQKALYVSQHPEARSIEAETGTELIDDIHRTLTDKRLMGNWHIPEQLGLVAVARKYFFKGNANTPGNSPNRWKDEFNFHDVVAVAGFPPVLITDASTGRKIYGVGTSRAKMVCNTAGGWQRSDGTEKTYMIAVQQPPTASTEYLMENGINSIAPGCTQGSTISLGAYIAPVDTSTLTILAYVYKRTNTTDQDGKGTVSVYRNNVLVDTKPCALARIDGGHMAFFSPFDESFAQFAGKQGLFFAAQRAFPGSSMERMQLEYNEMLTEVAVGDTIQIGSNPTAPVVTDDLPTGPISDGMLAPYETGMFYDTDGGFAAPSVMAASSATAAIAQYLPKDKSGLIVQQYKATKSFGATIRLGSIADRSNGNAHSFQISPDSNGVPKLSPAYNSVPTGQLLDVIDGYDYGFQIVGKTGTVSIAASPDIETTQPTLPFTFAQKATTDLYPSVALATAGGKLYRLRTQSMVNANLPLPDDGLFYLNRKVNLNDTTLGGYASMGTAGITTGSGFKVWGFTTLTQLISSNALITCKGFEGNNNEAFIMSVLDNATLYARLRTTDGLFPSPALANGNRLPFPLTQRLFWLLDAVPGKCRVIVGQTVSADATFSGQLPEVPTALTFGAGINTGPTNVGTAAFSIVGSTEDVGFGVSGVYLTDQEVDDLRNGVALPACTVRASSLRRTYASDLYSPDTVSPANPVLILDGGGL